MEHKFKLRQHVRLVRQGGGGAQRADVWEIVRLMPSDATGEPSYRILAHGVQRAAREADLQIA